MGSVGFSFIFTSKQSLRPLGYCAALLLTLLWLFDDSRKNPGYQRDSNSGPLDRY